MEILETRIAPASLSSQSGGVTFLGDTGVDDAVTVEVVGGFITITDAAAVIDVGATGFTLSNAGHTATAPGAIASLTIVTEDGNQSATILAAPVPITVQCKGTLTAMIGDGSAQAIQAEVHVQCASGPGDDLTIDASADTAAATITLSAGTVGAAGDTFFGTNGKVTYSGLEALTVVAGKGDDTVNLLGTSTGTMTSVSSSGTGTDTVLVGNNGSVQGVASPLHISHPLGHSEITLDDSADATGRTVAITNASVTGLAPATISFDGNDISSFTLLAGTGNDQFTINGLLNLANANSNVIDGGAGADTFTVPALSADRDATLRGGADIDTFQIGAGSLAAIVASLVVQGGDDSANSLVLDDTAAVGAQTYTLAADAITWTVQPGLTMSGITDVTLKAHDGDDTFNVTSTVSTSTKIMAGAGNNLLILGDVGGNLDGIASPVEFSGSGTNTFVVTDEGDTYGHDFTLTPAGLLSRDGTDILSGIAAPFTLTAGSGDDFIDLTGVTFAVEIFAGDGADTVLGTTRAGTLHGGAGSDTYALSHLTGDATVTDNGVTFPGGGSDLFPDHDFELVSISGVAAVNKFDATAFHGFAILDGNGGKDVIKGSDVTFTAKSVTFPDFDGDKVTVTTTKGHLTADNLIYRLNASGTGVLLETLDLLGDPAFNGASLTLKAKAGPISGDNFVNVGFVNAEGVDLAALSISGDLGAIVVGDDFTAAPAIGKLTVGSLFTYGDVTQGYDAPPFSLILGNAGSITVKGDVGLGFGPAGSYLQIVPDQVSLNSGNVASLTIGGDLETLVFAIGNLAKVKVAGSVLFGAIGAGHVLGSVTVGHDILGGFIVAGGAPDFAPTTQAASVVIKSLMVNGSVAGNSLILAGTDPFSDTINNPDVSIGAVTVKGSWSASSISAGVDAGIDGDFGNSDDVIATPMSGAFMNMPGGNPAIVATIAKISIGGQVGNGIDSGFPPIHDGFTAQQIKAFTIGRAKLPLTTATDNPLELGYIGAITVREVA